MSSSDIYIAGEGEPTFYLRAGTTDTKPGATAYAGRSSVYGLPRNILYLLTFIRRFSVATRRLEQQRTATAVDSCTFYVVSASRQLYSSSLSNRIITAQLLLLGACFGRCCLGPI